MILTVEMKNSNYDKGKETEIRIPNSREAEASVLGAMMMSREGLEIAEESGIDEQCFYSPDHVKIFQSIMALRDEARSIEPISVSNRLASEINLEMLRKTVINLASQFTGTAHIQSLVFLLRELAVRRSLLSICYDVVSKAGDMGISIDDIFELLQKSIDGFLTQTAPWQISDAATIIGDCIQEMQRVKFEDGLMNISSGMEELDQVTCGWAPGDMIVIAARPSDGKTALAMGLALNAAHNGKKVVFFSAEMKKTQIGFRILSNISGVNGMRLRNDDVMTDKEWQKVNDVLNERELKNLYIDDTPAISTAEFAAKARRFRRDKGVELILVDYLQLMVASDTRKNGNREQDVSSISKVLKATAKKLGVPVIALAQLSRNAERSGDEGPKLSDLRESGAIEQDADIVILFSKDKFAAANGDM